MKNTCKPAKIGVLTLFAISMAILQGCNHFAFPLEEVVAYRGHKPTEAEVVSEIKSYLRASLKDPNSARDLIVYAVTFHNLEHNGEYVKTPWYFCYKVNAKNSYGGYVGASIKHVSFSTEGSSHGEGHPISAGCSKLPIYRELGVIKY